MPNPIGPGNALDAATIREYLYELAHELPAGGHQRTVVLVGGAVLAWVGLRETTMDVDSASRLDDEVRAAVARVAARHDLDQGWLNDRAAGFAPVTLHEEECAVLSEHPRLRLLAAPLAQVFLMKLFAARERDWDDLVALWPTCGFTNVDQVVSTFYAAYPHEERDPYLHRHVRAIIRAAEGTGTG